MGRTVMCDTSTYITRDKYLDQKINLVHIPNLLNRKLNAELILNNWKESNIYMETYTRKE